jgi:farnesyl diphosphate synthase
MPADNISTLRNLMQQYQLRVDRALEKALSTTTISTTMSSTPETFPNELITAMRYSIFNGGKRVRAILVYMTAETLNMNTPALDRPACAVELIHGYSLVHDDMPAMDNDDLRRGKPTCHKQFSEATALLTGDALQTLAFEILSDVTALSDITALSDASLSNLSALENRISPASKTDFNCEQRIKMIATLARASGINGMAGGQALDLAATGKKLDLEELKNLHEHKTGALIRASIRLGALAHPDIDQDTFHALEQYAQNIGLSFQIKDDILDIESDTQTLGKQQGADIDLNKVTYPALLGLEGARKMAWQCHQNALDNLSQFKSKADPLRWLSEYIITRDH